MICILARGRGVVVEKLRAEEEARRARERTECIVSVAGVGSGGAD